MQPKLSPQILARNEGSAVLFLNTLTFIKATGQTTGSAFGLIEQLMPVGFETPYHVHHAEDEAFYVLEGEVLFICDGKKLKAGPGAYIFGPRDIPHGFRVEGTAPARMLVLNTPSGFEQFVREMSEPAATLTLPVPTPPDMGKLVALAAKYRIEILGELPV